MPIEISTSTTAPTKPPLFDPRDGQGISLHYMTFPSRRLYVGLQRTGSPQWFYIESTQTIAGQNPGTGNPQLVAVYVSGSEVRPDFFPNYPILQAKAVQYHVVYGAQYELCVGITNTRNDGEESSPAWAIYYANGTHTSI